MDAVGEMGGYQSANSFWVTVKQATGTSPKQFQAAMRPQFNGGGAECAKIAARQRLISSRAFSFLTVNLLLPHHNKQIKLNPNNMFVLGSGAMVPLMAN